MFRRIIVFVALLTAGMYIQDYVTFKRQLVELRRERLDVLAMNEVRQKVGEFAETHKLTYNDTLLHSVAMANATRCVVCDHVWEYWGSSQYYSVPFTATFSNEHGDGSYVIVPVTEYHVDDMPVQYDPAFAIYFTNRAGDTWRIGADGSVDTRTEGGEWLPVEGTSERVAGFRQAALSAALSAFARQSIN